MECDQCLNVFLPALAGALAGSLPVVFLTWWLTVSARKSAARSQRRIERSLDGINDALQRMAYWTGFDAKRQVDEDVAAAREEAGQTEAGDDSSAG